MKQAIQWLLIRIVTLFVVLVSVRFLFQFPVNFFGLEMLKQAPLTQYISGIDMLKVVVVFGLFFILFHRNTLARIKLDPWEWIDSMHWFLYGFTLAMLLYVLRILLHDQGALTIGNFVLLVIYLLAWLGAGICFAIGVLGLPYIKKIVSRLWGSMIVTGIFTAVSYFLLLYVQQLWQHISNYIGLAMLAVLTPIYSVEYIVSSSGPTFSVGDFIISIGQNYSGIGSLWLFIAFAAAIFIFDREQIYKGKFFIAFIVGLVGAVMVNIVRLTLLMLIGIHISADLALGLFRTNAGWILFAVYFVLFYLYITRYVYKMKYSKASIINAKAMQQYEHILGKQKKVKRNKYFVMWYFSDITTFFATGFFVSILLSWGAGFEVFLDDFRYFLFALMLLLINYNAAGMYKERRSLFDAGTFMVITQTVATTFFILLVSSVLLTIHGSNLYIITILTFILLPFSTAVGRYGCSYFIDRMRRNGYNRQKVFFFGDEKSELVDRIKDSPWLGYDLVGVSSSMRTLRSHLDRVDIVFVRKDPLDDEVLNLMIEYNTINWKIIPSVMNLVIDPVDFDEFKDYPIININSIDRNRFYMILKRGIDVVLSGLALLVLSPIMVGVAILIKTTSRGPVFFTQERLGKNLVPFHVYKFRTMVADADSMKDKLETKNEVKGLFKMKNDPRITPVGNFLRRTCLDELAQLINIFKGDMSIVGPRPHLERELNHFEGWRMMRFSVKPGLTGMWQVNGRHELNFDKAVLYDIYYVKHVSFVLDMSIIFKTVPAILLTRGKY